MEETTTELKWHRVLGAIASLFMLGAGQLAFGRYRRAAALLFAAFASMVLGAVSGQLVLMDLTMAAAMLLRIFGVVEMLWLRPGKRVPKAGEIALLWLGLIVVLWIGGFAFRQYMMQAFRIPSGAMIPTLQVGDHIFVSKLVKTPQRGEVIVFTYPIDPDKDFIKRVVAVGGDTVQVCGGQVLLNGQPLKRTLEPGQCQYQDYDEERPDGGMHNVPCVAYREWNGKESYITVHSPQNAGLVESCTTPATVPPGHVFVMGDNRDNSHDSRYWGTVRPELFKGKAWFIWWSKSPNAIRWNRINHLVHQPAPN